MDVKQQIRNFKKAVDSSIEGLDMGIGIGDSLTEEARIIDAQKKGVLTAKDIIYKIYKLSSDNGLKNSKWIITSIKKLTQTSDMVLNKLSGPLTLSYDEIDSKDEANVNKFYDNKKKATDAWLEVSAAMKDLSKLIDSQDENGDIVIEDDSEFKAGKCEVHAELELAVGTKAGYNEEIDAVIIDPNGSIGEIVNVYGLKIALPKPPARTKIRNRRIANEKEQFWKRDPKDPKIKPDTAEEYDSFINEEFIRKREGIWFFNNGRKEYITGAHWFLMQHGRTDADGDDYHEHGYFHFRTAHRDIFYFMEAVWADKRSLGLIYEKTRRTGATYCMVGFALCKAITTMDGHYGLTSKTGEDAAAIFTIMIVRMFQNLPFYFKPNRATDSPKTEYEFRQVSMRRTKKNQDVEFKNTSLNTGISYKNTTNDAYDQYALKLYIGDEFSKWKKPADIMDHWRMISRAMTKGRRITGKAFLLSTIENVKGYDDPTDKDAGTGDKFKYLYKNSDPEKRNSNGRTSSGLYKLFIPCDDNFEGFIDLYGYPVKNKPEEPIRGVDGDMIDTGINEFLEAEAATKETQDERYNFWRLNPRTEEEGFRVAVEDSIYDVKRIDTQITYNESFFKAELYTRGNFEWEDGVNPANPIEARVKFCPDETNGRFLVSWMPPLADRNKKFVRNGVVRPANDDMGALGCDPFRVVQAVNRMGSNGSIHGLTSFTNPFVPNGKFFLEYIHRPEDTDSFAWDIIKACIFYGMQVLIESNVPEALKFMYDNGFTGYAMRRPDKPKLKYSEQEKRYGGMPASTGNIDSLANVVAWYIKSFVGGNEESTIKSMPFNRTLTDWMKFKKENRTKHDATVSSSLAIFANRHDAHIVNAKGKQNGRHVSMKMMKSLTHNGII